MKKIMILGASILQLPAIVKAKELGLEVIAVDMNPEAVGFKVEGVNNEIISTIDTEKILEAAKRHNIDGIMTLATDMPMRSVATVARELNLVGIDQETALKATNKAEMRKALHENDVPIPRFYKVSTLEEFKDVIQEFPDWFMIKPADSSGSRGIYLANSDMGIDELVERYNYSVQYSKIGDVVVEEYMRGPEVSVETLSVDGVCHVIQITDKMTTGAPHFVELGHAQPTKHRKEVVDKIAEIAKAANRAIGIKNGPSHTEIIVTSDGPKIVELGARLGGDNIATHLVPLSTGVNMVECCIKIALGEKPDFVSKWSRGAAIRYFDQHAGIVKSIDGLEEAERISGVQQISIVHGVGEKISDVTNSGERMGFVIAQDECAEKAIEDCNAALDRIKVTNYK